jgi:hypothetical protein
MKNALYLLLLISFNSAAESLTFENIRINELAKVAYSQIIQADYIADNEFNNDAQTVSVYVKDKNKQQIKNILAGVIQNAGYEVAENNNIIRITKRKKELEPDVTPFYYKPKYRDVVYLTDMVSNIFKVGAFTFKKQVQSSTAETDRAGVQTAGNSAQSLISKPLDAFIFNGTKNEINALEKLLLVLDVPDDQVQITAYLYEVTNTDNKQSSFNIAANLLTNAFNLNLGTAIANNVLNFKVGNIQAGISALASDSRFNVISSPLLTVKNRQKGSFNVGAEVPILGNVSYQNNGQAVQSVEYKPSGVLLDLTPVFHKDNIELTIHHQISNFVLTNTGVNNSPTLIKRELNTVVNSGFQDVILLGGLSESKETNTKSGSRFLPEFLRANSSDISKSDILLLLHVNKI